MAGHEVVLRGLPERVIAELLAGLQRRTDAGLWTLPTSTRCLVKLLHARQAVSWTWPRFPARKSALMPASPNR